MSTVEELLAKIQGLENELEKRKRSFEGMAGTFNELNNLLAVMKGHAQLTLEDRSEGDENELIRIVLTTTSRAQQLIKNAMTGSPASDQDLVSEQNIAPATTTEILVVDDEEMISELLYLILTKQGHRVTVSNSGASALKVCKEQHFDIIFLDINLGDMSGIDVFRKIRDMPTSPHVVFFSGDLAIKDIQRMVRQEGADGFIQKPFDINEINSVVQYIMSMRACPSRYAAEKTQAGGDLARLGLDGDAALNAAQAG